MQQASKSILGITKFKNGWFISIYSLAQKTLLLHLSDNLTFFFILRRESIGWWKRYMRYLVIKNKNPKGDSKINFIRISSLKYQLWLKQFQETGHFLQKKIPMGLLWGRMIFSLHRQLCIVHNMSFLTKSTMVYNFVMEFLVVSLIGLEMRSGAVPDISSCRADSIFYT